MSGRVRSGGRIEDGAGSSTWSVADGSRGRRWRETTASLSIALETDPAGRFVKVEAASGDALLTLHREPDGSLHGHVVGPGGVRHLALGVLEPPLVAIEGSRLADAALVGGLAGGLGVGEASARRAVLVSPDLGVETGSLTVRRDGDRTWTISGQGGVRRVALGDDGLPAPSAGERRWPLER